MNAKLWIYRGSSVKIYTVISLNSRVLTKGMGQTYLATLYFLFFVTQRKYFIKY